MEALLERIKDVPNGIWMTILAGPLMAIIARFMPRQMVAGWIESLEKWVRKALECSFAVIVKPAYGVGVLVSAVLVTRLGKKAAERAEEGIVITLTTWLHQVLRLLIDGLVKPIIDLLPIAVKEFENGLLSDNTKKVFVLALVAGVLSLGACNRKVMHTQGTGLPVSEQEWMEPAGRQAPALIELEADEKPKAKEPVEVLVYFEFDSDKLCSQDIILIQNLALCAPGHSEILVEGHTCPIGPEEYNYQLGLRRALAVKTELNGLVSVDVKCISYGEADLVHDDRERYHENRRCKITLR